MFGGLHLGYAYYGAGPIGEISVKITNPDIDGLYKPKGESTGSLIVAIIDTGYIKPVMLFGNTELTQASKDEGLLTRKEIPNGSFIRKK